MCPVSHIISAVLELFAYANKWIYDSRCFGASIPPRSPSFDRKTLIFFALHPLIGNLAFRRFGKQKLQSLLVELWKNVKCKTPPQSHFFVIIFYCRLWSIPPHIHLSVPFHLFSIPFCSDTCGMSVHTADRQKWRLYVSTIRETIRLYSYFDIISFAFGTAQQKKNQHSIAQHNPV